jgi:hypothetical protein
MLTRVFRKKSSTYLLIVLLTIVGFARVLFITKSGIGIRPDSTDDYEATRAESTLGGNGRSNSNDLRR